MLYVIGTDDDGAVNSATPCPKGIDQALGVITSALMRSEDDAGVIDDYVFDRWQRACSEAGTAELAERCKWFGARRVRFGSRYGLAVVNVAPEVPRTFNLDHERAMSVAHRAETR